METAILGKIKWLVIIGLILYVIFLQECKRCPKCEEIITDTVKTDTIRISHTDTVRFTDTIIRRIYSNTPAVIDTSDTVHIYKTFHSDSLIDAAVISSVKGTLLSNTLEYTPLFPKYIIRTDSVLVTNTINIIPKPKTSVYIGGEIGGGYNQFHIKPELFVKSPKGNLYGAGYEYDFKNKTHCIFISVARKISFKRKGNDNP